MSYSQFGVEHRQFIPYHQRWELLTKYVNKEFTSYDASVIVNHLLGIGIPSNVEVPRDIMYDIDSLMRGNEVAPMINQRIRLAEKRIAQLEYENKQLSYTVEQLVADWHARNPQSSLLENKK